MINVYPPLMTEQPPEDGPSFSAGSVAAFAALLLVFIGGAVFIFVSAAGGSDNGASSANGLKSDSGLPATQVVPLTQWSNDEHISNLAMRIVKVQGACFVETISGGNGLNVTLTATSC